MKLFITCLILCVSASALLAQDATQEPSPLRQCLQGVQSYTVYYGEGEGHIEGLAQYDLAIIQPIYTPEQIKTLHAHNTLLIAYLSVGEADPEQVSDPRVKKDWILGKNENWGSFFIDSNQKGWRNLMVTLAGDYLAQGYDGIFLDTVDTAEAYPETAAGMVTLIQGLREAYPDALIVQNRGFSVMEQTAPFIDAIMFEDLSTTYNFDSKTYARYDNSEDADQVAALMAKTGLVVLALDYAADGDTKTAQDAARIAKDYGFVWDIATIDLNSAAKYGLAAPLRGPTCAAP